MGAKHAPPQGSARIGAIGDGNCRKKHADATAVKAEFLELEFPADFITKQGEFKAGLETARQEQSGNARTGTGATTSLAEDFAEGMSIVNELNTLCKNRFGRNPQTKDARKLREWRQARHIKRPTPRNRPHRRPERISPAQIFGRAVLGFVTAIHCWQCCAGGALRWGQ